MEASLLVDSTRSSHRLSCFLTAFLPLAGGGRGGGEARRKAPRRMAANNKHLDPLFSLSRWWWSDVCVQWKFRRATLCPHNYLFVLTNRGVSFSFPLFALLYILYNRREKMIESYLPPCVSEIKKSLSPLGDERRGGARGGKRCNLSGRIDTSHTRRQRENSLSLYYRFCQKKFFIFIFTTG